MSAMAEMGVCKNKQYWKIDIQVQRKQQNILSTLFFHRNSLKVYIELHGYSNTKFVRYTWKCTKSWYFLDKKYIICRANKNFSWWVLNLHCCLECISAFLGKQEQDTVHRYSTGYWLQPTTQPSQGTWFCFCLFIFTSPGKFMYSVVASVTIIIYWWHPQPSNA